MNLEKEDLFLSLLVCVDSYFVGPVGACLFGTMCQAKYLSLGLCGYQYVALCDSVCGEPGGGGWFGHCPSSLGWSHFIWALKGCCLDRVWAVCGVKCLP